MFNREEIVSGPTAAAEGEAPKKKIVEESFLDHMAGFM
jgi:hypothetical protein